MMAKKKVTTRAVPNADSSRELETLEERLRVAREELREAHEAYRAAKAAQQAEDLAEGSVGELLDTGLSFVRKYPALGVATATIVGVVLGRLFRR